MEENNKRINFLIQLKNLNVTIKFLKEVILKQNLLEVAKSGVLFCRNIKI